MSLLVLKSKIKKHRRKLLGRGNSSGHGTYCGKGGKGQTARTGGSIPPGFEGGQTPISRKMPKIKGFRNPNMIKYIAVNVGDLDKLYKKEEIDLTNSKKPIKLLGEGEVTKAFKVKVAKASKSAIEKIQKAGGKVEVKEVETKEPPKAE
jgi:large subunit ribosomal protein L15